MGKEILGIFPLEYRHLLCVVRENAWKLNEIRIRVGQPLTFLDAGEEWFVDALGQRTNQLEKAFSFTREDVNKIWDHLCNYSTDGISLQRTKNVV